MTENTFQNIDNPLDNPILNETVKTTKKTLKNPKILVLIILSSIIIILLAISLVLSATKNSKSLVKTTIPVSTITNSPLTTPTPSANQIPLEFQAKFNEIESEINNTKNFLPPQIDTEIGIKTE